MTLAKPYFGHAHPQNFQMPFNLQEFVPGTRLATPIFFLIMPNQKTFEQLLIFRTLYQHTKNEAASFICSGEIVDLKILFSDWLTGF